jgi:hypothetical protein
MSPIEIFGVRLLSVCGAIAILIWLFVYFVGKKFPIATGYVDYLDENVQPASTPAERAWMLKRRTEYAVLVASGQVSSNEKHVIERLLALRKKGEIATVRVLWKKQSGITHFWLQVRRADQRIEDPSGPPMANNPSSTG